ncbi:sulfotransferase domain-containing protein [Sphingomonas sp. ST-64]|uniref:Sulfotransferase domain-containing protein n=1 Tax=Sphingomonas plantiphila TaxID=3163295 RepID=A0ABW8YI20_9SPHN
MQAGAPSARHVPVDRTRRPARRGFPVAGRCRGGGDGVMPVVWLASYPKSGNTWFRAVLQAILSAGAVDINTIDPGEWGPGVGLFEEVVGLPFDELSADERRCLRGLVVEQVARESERPVFWKTHEAFLPADGDFTSFGSRDAARVIYLVRDPRDVACSYAHHRGKSIDDTIERMASSDHVSQFRRGGLVIDEPMGSWSDHALAWLAQTELPVHLLRFEDMLADPLAAFGKALSFSGVACSEADLAKAIDAARFERLQAQERDTPFHERPRNAAPFFRSGRAGGWRNELSIGQIASIESAHAKAMHSLGYDRSEAGPIEGEKA